MVGCFACFKPAGEDEEADAEAPLPSTSRSRRGRSLRLSSCSSSNKRNEAAAVDVDSRARAFTYGELSAATDNFRAECLLGEGGFGRVYRGRLESGQVVAVKQLDREGAQGNREFVVEVLMLSLLHHPNLVNLVGYCADGEQRLLVYEYMALGSLADHLLLDRRGNCNAAAAAPELQVHQRALSWETRMRVALGAARGLEYLHETANPPVIYRDLKSSNVLLDSDYRAKLSDFGLARNGPTGDKSHVSTRVVGTRGYAAPEYIATGHLSTKSDVYSFGVVLLELVSGRRAVDDARGGTLVDPQLGDRRKVIRIMDTRLGGQYPKKQAQEVAALALRCLQNDPKNRPAMADAVLPELEQLLLHNSHKSSSYTSSTPPPVHRPPPGRPHAKPKS